jgi:hypothetical protein
LLFVDAGVTMTTTSLCYLDASRVFGPTGDLGQLDVRGRANERLGTLEGVLIDPEDRRLRFYVLEVPGWVTRHRYLLPADAAARVDREENTLRLELEPEDLKDCEEFDMSSFREFTPEDAIAPTFARYIA